MPLTTEERGALIMYINRVKKSVDRLEEVVKEDISSPPSVLDEPSMGLKESNEEEESGDDRMRVQGDVQRVPTLPEGGGS